jgi:hypothetical protein
MRMTAVVACFTTRALRARRRATPLHSGSVAARRTQRLGGHTPRARTLLRLLLHRRMLAALSGAPGVLMGPVVIEQRPSRGNCRCGPAAAVDSPDPLEAIRVTLLHLSRGLEFRPGA